MISAGKASTDRRLSSWSGLLRDPGKRRETQMGKAYKVYRMDYLTKMKIPIGIVTERRNQPRNTPGHLGLVKLARQMFAQSDEDRMRIIVGEELVP